MSRLIDRLLGAIPLASIVLWLAIVQMLETVGRKTPTIFTDELEWSQISRAIADDGHPARRGAPIFFKTLYVYLIAPAWWLGDTASAYDAVKYLNAVAMALAAIPAYLLARRFVSKPTALAAALATICMPSLAYASYLIPEVPAYPWSVLCAYLCVESLAGRGRRWTVAAVAACLIAPLVRLQLGVLPLAYGVAALGLWWAGPRARRLRAGWSRADAIGFWLLVVGAFVVFNRAILHHSDQWALTSEYFRGRILQHALWAWGALTIGIGFLPTTAGLLALFPRREERERREDRAFLAFFASALGAFLFYTGLKGAYLSTQFATRVVERNLIYLSPLLLVATAIVLERRRIRLVPLAAATTLTIFLAAYVPIQLDYPYYEALGFSIMDFGNRALSLPQNALQWWAIGIAAGLAALLLGLWLADRRGIRTHVSVRAATAVVALLVVAWGMTGQVYASRGAGDESAAFLAGFPVVPPNAIDKATGGQGVTYLGQQIRDANGVWLLEFWNRAIKNVWSLDGTAPGPGPSLSPDLLRADGTLRPKPPTPYALTDNGVQLAGEPVLEIPGTNLRLYKLNGTWRLRAYREGVSTDGWMSLDSAYSRFVGARHGTLALTLSRTNFCPPADQAPPAGEALVQVGPLHVNANHQPELARSTPTRVVKVPNCKQVTVDLPVGAPPWRVQVHFDRLFRPSDAGYPDGRELGAQVTYVYTPA